MGASTWGQDAGVSGQTAGRSGEHRKVQTDKKHHGKGSHATLKYDGNKTTIKDLYVYPLTADFKERLRTSM